MAQQENIVTIVAWPKEPAALEHHFVLEKPCPVSISFEKTPATVIVQTSPQQPLQVDMNMNMNVVARQPIPLCIKVCEPICARSDYTIGIDIFDRPVAAITVKGQTRFFNCREEG